MWCLCAGSFDDDDDGLIVVKGEEDDVSGDVGGMN